MVQRRQQLGALKRRPGGRQVRVLLLLVVLLLLLVLRLLCVGSGGGVVDRGGRRLLWQLQPNWSAGRALRLRRLLLFPARLLCGIGLVVPERSLLYLNLLLRLLLCSAAAASHLQVVLRVHLCLRLHPHPIHRIPTAWCGCRCCRCGAEGLRRRGCLTELAHKDGGGVEGRRRHLLQRAFNKGNRAVQVGFCGQVVSRLSGGRRWHHDPGSCCASSACSALHAGPLAPVQQAARHLSCSPQRGEGCRRQHARADQLRRRRQVCWGREIRWRGERLLLCWHGAGGCCTAGLAARGLAAAAAHHCSQACDAEDLVHAGLAEAADPSKAFGGGARAICRREQAGECGWGVRDGGQGTIWTEGGGG